MTKEEREIFEYAQKKIVEMIERWEENRWSKAEIIDMLTAHKRDAIFRYPEPERTIWVELYEKNIALRDGSFDQIYIGQNEALPSQQTEKPKPEPVQRETENSIKLEKLKSIWLTDPRLSVEDFIQKGNDKGFWNDNFQLTLQRSSSTYGTGKTFLGNIFIAFKDWSIPNHLDYTEGGRIFCEVFNIKIKESTKEPYKAFSSANRKQIAEIKRTFGIR